MADRLTGRRILIMETREEAQFLRLLRDQGADVVQCPMFSIEDAPDPAPVEAWVGRAIASPLSDLVLLTGEGMRRLAKLAERLGLYDQLISALAKTKIYARGPKPVKALRELGLTAAAVTTIPTSEGIVALLKDVDLTGHRLGLQLYPERDHSALIAALTGYGATVDPVSPYVYDDKAAETNIIAAIQEMAQGRIDALALTSSGQVRRLVDAARAHGLEAALNEALTRTPIASVGPVVTDALRACGLQPAITPSDNAFFMKPLISALATHLQRETSAPAHRAGMT